MTRTGELETMPEDRWRSCMRPQLKATSVECFYGSMCFPVLGFERIAFTFLQLASVAALMVTSMHLSCEDLRVFRDTSELDAVDFSIFWVMKLWILREALRFCDSRTCWGSHHLTIRRTPDRKPFSNLQKNEIEILSYLKPKLLFHAKNSAFVWLPLK